MQQYTARTCMNRQDGSTTDIRSRWSLQQSKLFWINN